MFYLDNMVDCGEPVLCGSTQHLRMEAVRQRQECSHPRAKTGQYENAYESSLARPQLIHKHIPKSSVVLMKAM